MNHAARPDLSGGVEAASRYNYGLHHWATEADDGWESMLKGSEWDRAAWADVEIGGEAFAVCPRCQALVRCAVPLEPLDGLLIHRGNGHNGY